MARFNADGSPSGRPRFDDEGNTFVGTHEQVLASNDEVNRRYGLGIYSTANNKDKGGGLGGVGQIGGRKQRFGREQMVTGSASGTILAP